MAEQEIIIEMNVDELIENVIATARLLLALGRERLLAVAGDYLVERAIAEAGGIDSLTLDELALGAAGRALLCRELDKLTAAARAALAEMSPEQQLSVARERMSSLDTQGLKSADIVDGMLWVTRDEVRPGKVEKAKVELSIP